MQHVRVRLTAHGNEAAVHPIWDLLANGACVDRATAIQWSYTGDAIGMLHYVEGDADGFEAAIEATESVTGFDLVRIGEGAFYAYVRGETTSAMVTMWGSVSESPMIIVPPIRYHEDGTMTMTVFGPEEEHGRAIGRIPDPVEVSVEAVGDLASMLDAGSRLSDRQREAVATGLELGYYETPRDASQADVAEAMGCSPSTAAEHLQKAEATLARAAFGQ